MNTLKVTITGLLAVCLSIGVVNAQTSPTTPAKTSTPKTKTAKATTGTAAATTTTKPAQHLKKDGTPDMRYKENKTAKSGTAVKPAAKTTTGAATPKKAPAKKTAPAGAGM